MGFGKRFSEGWKSMLQSKSSRKIPIAEHGLSTQNPTAPVQSAGLTRIAGDDMIAPRPGAPSDPRVHSMFGNSEEEAGFLNPNTSQNVEVLGEIDSRRTSSNRSSGRFVMGNADNTGDMGRETIQLKNAEGISRRNVVSVAENIHSAAIEGSLPEHIASRYRAVKVPTDDTEPNYIVRPPSEEDHSGNDWMVQAPNSSALANNPTYRPVPNNVNGNNGRPQTNQGASQLTAMFGGNVLISGGTVVQNVRSSDRPGFKLLRERVATAAFHNSAQRVDPPRCHPDTRVAILDQIYDWITQSEDRDEWLLWLNGAAGAGKSAIIQSTAERCVQTAIAIASFFFFRTDSTRNTVASLVATLVYQLIQVLPNTSDDILSMIERNPLIFDQSLVSQLQELLIQPLLRLPSHLQPWFVVFIDGLDECNDRVHQSELIKVLGNISRGKNTPVVFIVSSRREPQIEAAFVDTQVSALLRKIPLDNSDIEQTSDDIQRFLIDKLTAMKETHLRRHLLPADWPPMSAVEEITTKSSGQFIYASVIVSYVSSPRANPAHQLEVVRGIRMRGPSSQNPFAHLDALYQHIFSQVEALDMVLDILAYVLITEVRGIYHLDRVFLLEAGELEVYFADLTAVVECEPNISNSGQLKFLHASLPDFLRDKTRSERFYIDIDEYKAKLLCMLLDRVPGIPDPLSLTDASKRLERKEASRISAIKHLLASGIKMSDRLQLQLQPSFMNFNFTFYELSDLMSPRELAKDILRYLTKLDFGDERQAYHHVLEAFAVEFAKNQPSLNSYDKGLLTDNLGLEIRISQILAEKAQV